VGLPTVAGATSGLNDGTSPRLKALSLVWRGEAAFGHGGSLTQPLRGWDCWSALPTVAGATSGLADGTSPRLEGPEPGLAERSHIRPRRELDATSPRLKRPYAWLSVDSYVGEETPAASPRLTVEPPSVIDRFVFQDRP